MHGNKKNATVQNIVSISSTLSLNYLHIFYLLHHRWEGTRDHADIARQGSGLEGTAKIEKKFISDFDSDHSKITAIIRYPEYIGICTVIIIRLLVRFHYKRGIH